MNRSTSYSTMLGRRQDPPLSPSGDSFNLGLKNNELHTWLPTAFRAKSQVMRDLLTRSVEI